MDIRVSFYSGNIWWGSKPPSVATGPETEPHPYAATSTSYAAGQLLVRQRFILVRAGQNKPLPR